MATPNQIDTLIRALQHAKLQAKEKGEVAYANTTLELMTNVGPWRLIIGVYPPNDPHARG